MKDLNYYLKLPYTISFHPDEDGAIVARVDELPGCEADGPTVPEALENLDELKKAWIEEAIGSGQHVPEPTGEAALPSGKWVQRVPRSLHQKLSRLAKREGVSLNSLVTSMLSEAVGDRTAGSSGVNATAWTTNQIWGTTVPDEWHQMYVGCIPEPENLPSVTTVHVGGYSESKLTLANRLQLIIAGLPDYHRELRLKDNFDAKEKSQKLGTTC
jgi:antitoxin HicB